MANENVFDLYNVFIEELIGNVGLSVIIGLMLIYFVGIRMKMPYEVINGFVILWLGIIFSQSQIPIIWVMTGLIVGAGGYYYVFKAMR